METTSLYVHIPFCASKCFYCDFNSYVSTSDVMERFVAALDVEFRMLSERYEPRPLETVFFGGGTPSLLSAPQLKAVLASLHRHFPLSPTAEITLEANPGTVDEGKFDAMLQGGVNRISFGAQTFDDTLLQAIGRLHDAAAIINSYQLARRAGFTSINLDLMFGLPGQTLELLERTLERVFALKPAHLSAYGLKIEQGTPFAVWYDRGHLQLPPVDDDARMYERVIQAAKAEGYTHYEVSNFAVQGRECRHNLVYWRNEPYFAAGPGAHGYVAGVRYENIRGVPAYMRTLEAGERPVQDQLHILSAEEREDTMILGLRLLEGISFERFALRHGVTMQTVFSEAINRNVSRGFLQMTETSVSLTERGLLLANEVFADFLTETTERQSQ